MNCMQAPQTLVSVEEYLNTSYEGPDREYVDGRIVERNLGEQDHSWPQGELIVFFASLRKTLGAYAFPEQRVQVKATRFRVPDVCVYIGGRPSEQVFRTPPFLVVEILSKDDRASDLKEKLGDYRDFGIPFVWAIDPRTRSGYTCSLEDGFKTKKPGLQTKNPDIELPVERLFEAE
jgi:Uma2 family endonuclease